MTFLWRLGSPERIELLCSEEEELLLPPIVLTRNCYHAPSGETQDTTSSEPRDFPKKDRIIIPCRCHEPRRNKGSVGWLTSRQSLTGVEKVDKPWRLTEFTSSLKSNGRRKALLEQVH
ncbi:hypothetical protein O181_032590 [Austropuccinia psidii MF-1]|uniref:Uncharacterized protein n=1 Tax=Austropuccinia psidii MF-1 TaxID=1389203 RepID=A0A9Q3D1B3_9BASI|nr:hypothetical protein [Austropuccinia psidii MF-1]